MNKTIVQLVAEMQAIFENSNGTLGGGYSAINGNGNFLPISQVNDTSALGSLNDGPCQNGYCGGSTNKGGGGLACTNAHLSCPGSTNTGKCTNVPLVSNPHNPTVLPIR